MNIGLDIDGPIYPWHQVVITYYRIYKGYTGNDSDFWKYFRTLSVEEQDYIVALPDLYDKIVLSPNTVETLNKLAEIGTLYYITARPESTIDITRKFFGKSKLPFKENLIFSTEKSVPIRLNSISFYIDDNQDTVRKLQRLTTAYWYRVAWWEDKNDLPTVDTLDQYLEIIERTKDNGKPQGINRKILLSTKLEMA